MLILVAHGTRSAAGVAMIEQLRRAVAARIGPVTTSFVDVLGPNPAEVLAGAVEPAVVVPAFLASGYHVRDDLPARIAESGHHDVTVQPALGPDPMLAKVMHDRLREVGWRPGDAVVMAAAGSLDSRAQRELAWAAGLLARQIGRVNVGYVATGVPRVADVVDGLRRAGRRRVFIASYLLAPGLFHDRLADCGATAVTAPLGMHPGVVDLVVSRFLRRNCISTSKSASRRRGGCSLGAAAAVRTCDAGRVAAPCRRRKARLRRAGARAAGWLSAWRAGHSSGSRGAMASRRNQCA